MNISVLTQHDAFYIPPLLERLFRLLPDRCSIVGAAVMTGEVSTGNIREYLRFMGPLAFVHQGAHYVKNRLLDMVDRVVRLSAPRSVGGAFRRHGVPTWEPASLGDPDFLRLLEEKEVDLVISVACPEIVPEEVFDLPTHGCINLHGALLSKYRGLLPSFWVLANGEDETDVTAHVMNEEPDDGPIVVQRRVPVEEDDTTHSLVLKSNVRYGAEALAEAIRQFRDGTVDLQENPTSEATYYSFPSEEAVSDFRR